MRSKRTNKLIISFWVIIAIVFQIYPGFNITSASSDLNVEIESEDNYVVTLNRYSHISVKSNLTSYLTIRAEIDNNSYLIYKNIYLTKDIPKDITIPIVYPLDKDFSLYFLIETVDASKKTTVNKDFKLRKLSNGSYSISGRVIKCSPTEKIGLEGAKIEVLEGPSYSFTYSSDDGYFTLEKLIKSTYKIRISHKCSSTFVDKIVIIGEKEAFIEVCLSTYGIPDIDLWLNKPSGESFELGETVTISMRSSFELIIDLYLEDMRGLTKPILLNKSLKSGFIHQCYWNIPTDESLGKKYLRLIPREKNLCGEARYSINVVGDIRYGVIRGKITTNGLPVQGAEVLLPLQFTDNVKTDSFGEFEIKNVPPGIHTLRCLSDGFYQVDLRGIQTLRGKITDNIEIELVKEKISYEIYPPEINVATHENREKVVEFELNLKEGFAKDVEIQKLEGPDEISLAPLKIPLLLKEKRILFLNISNRCPPGEYNVKFKIGNDESQIELSGKVIVSGLSFGTFDGKVVPNKITLPQGEEAKFKFAAEKYSNFLSTLEIILLDTPPYSKIEGENLKIPPVDINFSIITSLSTPVGLYNLVLKVKGYDQVNYYPFQLEVLKAGGELFCMPENGWNPILAPGETETIMIGIFAENGLTENVRLNIDYGPPWLVLNERNIGQVGQDYKYVPVNFSPPADIIPGGYNYSISFTYGLRNEGFLKFSGKINLLLTESTAPTNLRAKYIKEDSKVILTWGTPLLLKESDIAGYNIYKSTHYSSFEGGIPINSALIKDRYYEDLEFKYGKTYWYIVRAVDYNGNISPKSNTADVSIPSLANANFKFELEKGEGSTYFLGERLNFSFLGNVYGVLEVRLIQDTFSILILTKEVSPNLKYSLGAVIPGIYGKVKVEAKLTGDFGLSSVLEQEIIIKKPKAGNSGIKGILWNSNYDSPIPFVDILVYSGESFGRTVSKINGSFEINNLSNGKYTLIVNIDSFNIPLDQMNITNFTDLGKIEIPYKRGDDFIAWLPDGESSTKGETDLRISYISKTNTDVTVKIGSNSILREIIPFKEIEPSRVYSEYIKIPKDLPSGLNYLIIEDVNTSIKWTFPLTIEEENIGLSGIILDPFGNPIQDVLIEGFLDEEKEETTSNEFGYFSFLRKFEKITLTKNGYIKEEIKTSESNVEVKLRLGKGEIDSLNDSITPSLDMNDVDFKFLCNSGTLENFDLKIYSNDSLIFEKNGLDLFPLYLYELSLEGLSFEDTAKLSLESSSNLIKEIPIEKGLKSRIFADSTPESILVDSFKDNILELDFYSFGNYKKTIELDYNSNLEGLKVIFEPKTILPGNICKVNLVFNGDSPNGYYLLNIILKDDEKKAVIPMYFYLRDRKPNLLINSVWMPYLYVSSTDTYRFYFAKKPYFISYNESLEGLSFYTGDDFFEVKLKAIKEGISNFKFNILIGNEERREVNIILHTINKKESSTLDIKSTVLESGVETKVLGLKENYSYFINRIKEIEGLNFLNLYPISDEVYVDKAVNEMNAYTYSLFYTDGFLEANWSNKQRVDFRKLFLNINIKDGFLTNKNKIVITGSIPKYAKLAINGRKIIISKNGTFSETINLNEGENKIIFKVEDDFGNELIREIKGFLDSIPPEMEILNIFSDYIETTEESLLIKVRTEKDVILTISGITLEVDSSGYTEYLLKLNMGRNDVSVIATDLAGNQTRNNFIVMKYKKIILIELKVGSNIASVNGNNLTLDIPPQIINGRTLVPIRFISEAFGAEVLWDANTKEIEINFEGNRIELKVGSNIASVNGNNLTLDVPPQIINGRTLVPIRFISEAFGAEVLWDASTKGIEISYKA